MRPIPALLLAAGLATAPASAVAAPSSHDEPHPRTETIESFSWSSSRGGLGTTVMSLTPELRAHYGAPQDRGVLVARVERGTPAATAGIQVRDVIVGVEGRKIETALDVVVALTDVPKGRRVKVDLVRDGKARSVEVTLTDDVTAPPLDGWIKSFFPPGTLGSPFDDWPKLDQAPQHTDSVNASNWLGRLRELFGSSSSARRCEPS